MGRLDDLENTLNSVATGVDSAVQGQAAQATSITNIAADVARLKDEIAAINSRPTWTEADDASLSRMTSVIGPLSAQADALKAASDAQTQVLADLDAATPDPTAP